ncbi:MAG: hypothetical protein GEV07_21710 [Streptosporangiales bacterium]|nr:hypothetical protein [Streptosporangiales bacterium]
MIPMLREWRAAGRPITDVRGMAGLRVLLRRLVIDGGPVALGRHVIGDAAYHMNPTLGRGLSMALQGAVRVTDAIRQHPEAPYDQAMAVDAAARGADAAGHASSHRRRRIRPTACSAAGATSRPALLYAMMSA